MTEYLIQFFVEIIERAGYMGVGFLMTLESMVAPVPSEAVMPFAGFLWARGLMSPWLIIFSSTLGSIIGSLISYYIGKWGGRLFVEKYGKYFLLNQHHLEITENFFSRYGAKAIFFSRFIPVVRHLISLPAGAGKMNIFKFCVYTIVGAGIWNSFLTYLGYYLGTRWDEIRKYSEVLDIIIIILLIAAVGFWIFKRLKRKTASSRML
jgi:membrane protein DedA with SNARE-associated domain